MPSFLTVDEQLSLLLRGTTQVETVADLKTKLERGRPLRVKYGIDPTGFDVHLGHTVPLRKLRQFQELGHTAVLIIGTATAAVGDPSGRDASRQGLSTDQIEKNAQTYLAQIAKVIDITKAEVRPNGEWFNKWGFQEMLRLLGRATVQQMLAREDFSKRYKETQTPIYLHECLYPLMQGWDSVEIQADVELGGTEQLFNLMVGRDLQKGEGQEPQVPMTMPILRGTDGEKKMGKTAGNYIGLNDSPTDKFGKTMRIPDHLMNEWFVLLTDLTPPQIAEILAGKPDEAKKRLGAEVVKFYHGELVAKQVVDDWNKRNGGGDPDVIEELPLPLIEMNVLDLIVAAGFCKSKSEARKKVEEGAFNFGPDRTKPADFRSLIPLSAGLVIRLGRKLKRVVAG